MWIYVAPRGEWRSWVTQRKNEVGEIWVIWIALGTLQGTNILTYPTWGSLENHLQTYLCGDMLVLRRAIVFFCPRSHFSCEMPNFENFPLLVVTDKPPV